MLNIKISCNSTKQFETAQEIANKYSNIEFTIYNENNQKDIRDSIKLRRHWASTKCPFAILLNDSKAFKAFYSEADDVFTELEEYLKEQENE